MTMKNGCFQKLLLAAAALLMPVLVLAKGSAHGEIPKVVNYQFLNFFIFVAILFFLLRKKVVLFFQEREANFKQALLRAEAAKVEAEKQRNEIHDRLARLQSTQKDTVEQAKIEAQQMRDRILQDAKTLSAQMWEETKRTTEFEIQRAKAELKDLLVTEAVHLARTMLNEKMAEQDQKRLQSEFVSKIQEVGS